MSRRFQVADPDVLREAAECLKALGHPQRLQIVGLLLERRLSVGELAEACGIASHVASEHLRLMQRCGFLDSQREGRRTYYEVVEPHLADILTCLQERFATTKKKNKKRRTTARA